MVKLWKLFVPGECAGVCINISRLWEMIVSMNEKSGGKTPQWTLRTREHKILEDGVEIIIEQTGLNFCLTYHDMFAAID